MVRQALLLHESFFAAERPTAAGTAEAGLMEASTAPRHGDAPSNAELLPAGEASRALLHKRCLGGGGSGSLPCLVGIVDRLLQLRNDCSIRLWRRRALQEGVVWSGSVNAAHELGMRPTSRCHHRASASTKRPPPSSLPQPPHRKHALCIRTPEEDSSTQSASPSA
jgi:hypothetical protein